jgi:hypothetical protein
MELARVGWSCLYECAVYDMPNSNNNNNMFKEIIRLIFVDVFVAVNRFIIVSIYDLIIMP